MSIESPESPADDGSTPLTLLEVFALLLSRWQRLLSIPLLCGALAVAGSFLMKPMFTSEAQLLTPASQQGSLSALSSALGGGAAALVGGSLGGALKDPNDQWVAMLRSRAMADAMLDKFDLIKRYDTEHRFQAREVLAARTRVEVTKQGLISLQVEDHEPTVAQAMARFYIEELQRLSNTLAVSSAAKRRIFFDRQLNEAGDRLARAEAALKGAGVRDDVIKANPQATLEAIADVQRSILAAELQVAGLRNVVTDSSPQMLQAQSRLERLRSRLRLLQDAGQPLPVATAGGASAPATSDSYIARYRAFKYAEAVFDGIARQAELARLEEAREGSLVQALDTPSLPEWKTRPKRAFIGVFTSVGVGLLMVLWILGRERWQVLMRSAQGQRALGRLRAGAPGRRP